MIFSRRSGRVVHPAAHAKVRGRPRDGGGRDVFGQDSRQMPHHLWGLQDDRLQLHPIRGTTASVCEVSSLYFIWLPQTLQQTLNNFNFNHPTVSNCTKIARLTPSGAVGVRLLFRMVQCHAFWLTQRLAFIQLAAMVRQKAWHLLHSE